MSKNEGVSKGVRIYFTFGIIAVFFLNFHVIVRSSILAPRIGGFYGLVSCALAIIYGWKGFSKDAAKYYKLFMVSAFLSYQLAACTAGIQMHGAFVGVIIGFNCLTASFTLALMLSRDLGKKYSMAFSWGMFAITFAVANSVMIFYPGTLLGGSSEGSIAFFRSSSNFFVSQIVLTMTIDFLFIGI